MNAEETINLKCPQCAVSVKTLKSHAGKRIKCPSCGAVMKVPGVASAETQQDDWFDLETSPEKSPSSPLSPSSPSSPSRTQSSNHHSAGSSPKSSPNTSRGQKSRPSATTPPHPQASGTRPNASDSSTDSSTGENPSWLDNLPPIEAPVFPSPQTTGTQAASSNSPSGFSPSELAALTAAGGDLISPENDFDDDDSLPEPSQSKMAAVVSEVDAEFRAKCPVCESIHFCKPTIIGKKIRCGDCHSEFVVPKPKQVKPKPKPEVQNASTFKLAASDAARPTDTAPWQKSAAEYLRQAEDDVEDVDDPRKLTETPQIGEWLAGVFQIFAEPTVIMRWIVLSAIGAAPGILLVLLPHPVLIIGALVMMAVFFLYLVVSSFPILESVSNGQDRVTKWPAFSPGEWIGGGGVGVVAMLMAATPGALFGGMLLGLHVFTLATTMLSVFLLFPFLVLSMLDNGSVMAPVSTSVTKSITRCREAWGGLYFSAMLLFSMLYLSHLFSAVLPDLLAFIVNPFLLVGGMFTYFSMIGRLAFQIGHAINAPSAE